MHLDSHVELDRHDYSVPHPLVGRPLLARYTAHTIELLDRGQRVASHRRSHQPGRHTTVPEHMPESHRRFAQQDSPERFSRWAESIGPATAALIADILHARRHPEHSYRSCLGILRLAKTYSNPRLEAAAQRALTLGTLHRVHPQAPSRRARAQRGTRTPAARRPPQHPRAVLLPLSHHTGDLTEVDPPDHRQAPPTALRRHDRGTGRTTPLPPLRGALVRTTPRPARRPRTHPARRPPHDQPTATRQAATPQRLHRGHRLPTPPAPRQGPHPLSRLRTVAARAPQHPHHRTHRRRQVLARLCPRPPRLPRRLLRPVPAHPQTPPRPRHRPRRRPLHHAPRRLRQNQPPRPRRLRTRQAQRREPPRPPRTPRRPLRLSLHPRHQPTPPGSMA